MLTNSEMAFGHCTLQHLAQTEDRNLADIPPFKSLRHVRDLELISEDLPINPSWQQWPMSWSQLTALTSLSCMLDHQDTPDVPAVLSHMISLRRLKILQTFTDSSDTDAEYPESEDLREAAEQRILESTTALTRLTSLVIDCPLLDNDSVSCGF